MPVDPYLHLYERDLGFTHYEYGAAEEAFMQGNEEFVKENWKGALDHFSTGVCLVFRTKSRIKMSEPLDFACCV